MNSENLKKLLDDMAGVYYPGVDLCIYHKHREVFRYQAGYSDVKNKIPVDPNAMCYLFSCTKPLTEERIIGKRTIDIIRTNAMSYNHINEYWKMNMGYGYGLGVRTLIDNAAGRILSNRGEFGWDGAAGSFILMDPDEELAIFMAEFTRNPYNNIVPHRITNAVYSSLDK